MPQNLDEHTRGVIVRIIIGALAILGSANAFAQGIVIPKLRKQSGVKGWNGPPLLLACLASLIMMHLLSIVLTLPIVAFGKGLNADSRGTQSPSTLDNEELTSSINFCEDDFVDSNWIAEPANTASSLASYCPLALWGLFGLPSKEWSTRVSGHKRFAVAYGTLLAIGIGSTLLHALLTAWGQGGDELPMLWFVACLSYMALDLILQGTRINLSALISTFIFGRDPHREKKQGRWFLHWLVLSSAVVASAIYCFNRENFLPFLILFVLYALTATLGLLAVCFVIKRNDDVQFRCMVLLPLAVCTSSIAIFAIMSWGSEMLFCAPAQQSEYGPTIKWLWNRAIHPFWHCSSALLAWLMIQAMLAGQGLQRGWGEPQLRCGSWWYGGVPYVAFSKAPESGNGVKQS